MSNFILKQRNPSKVLDILREMVPQFPQSEEFRGLDAEDQMVAGLVCAAFTRYLTRLQMTLSQGNASVEDRSDLEQCYKAIERLATDDDQDIKNLVVVEIFENINSEAVLAEVLKRLRPNSHALYKHWLG